MTSPLNAPGPPRLRCRRGSWREETFKEYNFNALGQLPAGGHLHPLLKVRAGSAPGGLRPEIARADAKRRRA